MLGTELLKFFCVEIVRVRIERVEHAVDRGLKDLVIIDLLARSVILLDHSECLSEIVLDLLGRYLGALRVRLSRSTRKALGDDLAVDRRDRKDSRKSESSEY